jgi:hypothetical protein
MARCTWNVTWPPISGGNVSQYVVVETGLLTNKRQPSALSVLSDTSVQMAICNLCIQHAGQMASVTITTVTKCKLNIICGLVTETVRGPLADGKAQS